MRARIRHRIDELLVDPRFSNRVKELFKDHYKKPPKWIFWSLNDLDTMPDDDLLSLFEIIIMKVYQQR